MQAINPDITHITSGRNVISNEHTAITSAVFVVVVVVVVVVFLLVLPFREGQNFIPF